MFQKHIKSVSFIQNNINALRQYEALDGKFKYKLPEGWKTNLEEVNGKEIVYNNRFNGESLPINGFVQVWNLNVPLKKFLDSSKEVSVKQNDIRNYKIKDIEVNGKKGYLVNYTIFSNNEYYIANEYFIGSNNKMFRISFFVNSKNFKEGFNALFDSIVQTVNI